MNDWAAGMTPAELDDFIAWLADHYERGDSLMEVTPDPRWYDRTFEPPPTRWVGSLVTHTGDADPERDEPACPGGAAADAPGVAAA